MSTFDCTVNAGGFLCGQRPLPAVYPAGYPFPSAGSNELCQFAGDCLTGIGFGFLTKSINQICQWIVAGLYGGIAPNVLVALVAV